MDRTILAIDPGTGRCGWAVLSQNSARRSQENIRLLDCGCIDTPSKTPLHKRLVRIFDEIDKMIKKYKPTQMAIEELFFVKNVKTGISVGQARGVIMLAGVKNNLEIFEYKPNEIKLTIAGYGHATKGQMQKMLTYHIKGCSISQDDMVDAIAVGICHLQKSNSRMNL